MIAELPSPTLAVPVVLNLVMVFGAWIYYANRKSWPADQHAPGRIFRCRACGHVYVESKDLPLHRCPHCGAFNEAVRR